MKKTIKTLALSIMAAFMILPLASSAMAQTAYAVDAKSEICQGIGGGSNGGKCDVAGAGNLETTIKRVVDVFSLFAGIAAVIMILIGGFRYVVSSGDSGSVNSAKNTIIYAIVGLVVIVTAQLIVRFVLGKVI